jgi:tRNA(Ile)-lysidine synthase TilS/MesJ
VGIPPVRAEGTVRVVRPLLDCTRADILTFLDDRGIAYCTDSSNLDTRFARNRVRHELLPFDEHYNRSCRAHLAAVQCDENALDELAVRFWRHAEAAMRHCAPREGALQRRVLVLIARFGRRRFATVEGASSC